MKRFTILFSLLLVLGFAGLMIYVNALPEFTPPEEAGVEKEDPDAPVWTMSMDDLIAYLIEQGFLGSEDELDLLTEGVASQAYGFDGAEIYWWDLDTLEEDLLRRYDEILVLKDGALCEQGDFATLMEAKGILYSLYTVASR